MPARQQKISLDNSHNRVIIEFRLYTTAVVVQRSDETTAADEHSEASGSTEAKKQ